MEPKQTPAPVEPNKKTEAKEGSPSTTSPAKEFKAAPKNEEDIENQCKLCKINERQLAVIPCGHLSICQGCSSRCSLCPICKREVKAYVRIYC